MLRRASQSLAVPGMAKSPLIRSPPSLRSSCISDGNLVSFPDWMCAGHPIHSFSFFLGSDGKRWSQHQQQRLGDGEGNIQTLRSEEGTDFKIPATPSHEFRRKAGSYNLIFQLGALAPSCNFLVWLAPLLSRLVKVREA
jgi:hypothetical protein